MFDVLQLLGKAVLLPFWASWHLPFCMRFLYYATVALRAHGRASFGTISRVRLQAYLPPSPQLPVLMRRVMYDRATEVMHSTLPEVIVPLWFAYCKARGDKLNSLDEYTGVPPIITVLRYGDVPAFRVLLTLEVHARIVAYDPERGRYVHSSLPVALKVLVSPDLLTEEVLLLVLHHLFVQMSRMDFDVMLADMFDHSDLFAHHAGPGASRDL